MSNSKDPFDEVVEMVEDVFKEVSAVKAALSEKVDDKELRDLDRMQREYTDTQIRNRHDDQSAAIKQLIENMGSSLLTDFEEMGRDIEARLEASHQRFIDNEIQPLVGRLVEDEIKRKADREARERELQQANADKAELKERTIRMEKRERVYKIIAALGVVFGMVWTAIRIFQAFSGAG